MTPTLDQPTAMAIALQTLQGAGLTVDDLWEHTGHDPSQRPGGSVDAAPPLGVHAGDVKLPPTITVDGILEHARTALEGRTRKQYRAALGFLAHGWRVRPDEFDDAVVALLEVGLDAPRRGQVPTVTGRHGHPRLLLWPGHGADPARQVLRGCLDEAVRYKRAAVLTEATRRARRRREREQPQLARDWDGNGGIEGLITAARWMYKVLRGSGILEPGFDPTAGMKLPRRGDTLRREMDDQELVEVLEVILAHSPDPDLDRRLLRYHLWTANRPVAAYHLTVDGIDPDGGTITSRTKYGRPHTVPAPPVLCRDLVDFAADRGSTAPGDPAFRTKNRSPKTGELAALHQGVYDRLHKLVQRELAWAGEEGWTTYWCRHHAKARIQQIGGVDCAIALLGHTEKAAIEAYGKAGFGRLAWAVSQMTGQPHPSGGAATRLGREWGGPMTRRHEPARCRPTPPHQPRTRAEQLHARSSRPPTVGPMEPTTPPPEHGEPRVQLVARDRDGTPVDWGRCRRRRLHRRPAPGRLRRHR